MHVCVVVCVCVCVCVCVVTVLCGAGTGAVGVGELYGRQVSVGGRGGDSAADSHGERQVRRTTANSVQRIYNYSVALVVHEF